MFKVLFRRFRCFLREKFDAVNEPAAYIKWSIEQRLSRVKKFAVQQLKLPYLLLDVQNLAQLMTILFPRTSDIPIRGCRCDSDRKFLVDIFRDNNSKKRGYFFGKLLVRYLW